MEMEPTYMNHFKPSCDLCKLIQGKIITENYYEDERVIIVNCKSCEIPMLVLKDHRMELSSEEERDFEYIIKRQLPDLWYIRKKQRKIHDHLHWHIIHRRKEL